MGAKVDPKQKYILECTSTKSMFSAKVQLPGDDTSQIN